MEKIRAAIYIRVSTQEQADEGYSLAAQQRTLEEYCRYKKWDVVGVYADEGISGKNMSARPGLQNMLTAAKDHEFDILLVRKLSRFTRSLTDLLTACDMLEKYGIKLCSYEESFDGSTTGGRMVRNMLGVVAQFERETISDNVKAALEERAIQGYPTCAYVLGYDLINGCLVLNPHEAEIVKYIYKTYLTNKSLTETAAACAAHGYHGKRGHVMQPESVRRILTRPIYVGYNSFHGQLYKGSHTPIITTATFNRVQKLLRRQGAHVGRRRQVSYDFLQASIQTVESNTQT